MTQLTTTEKRKLKAHEETIERGQKAFIEVGRALMAIREEQLYLDVADTFESYVRKRWNASRDWAYKQIAAMEAAQDVDGLEVEVSDGDGVYTIGIQIENERQARELSTLETMQDRANAVVKAVETAKVVDGKPKITAAGIKKAIQETNSKPPKKKKPAPKTNDPTGKQWCNHQAKQLQQIVSDLDVWKKKHAKGDSRWITIVQSLDSAHKAFRGLGRVK